MLIIEAVNKGYGQFLLDSLPMKDTFGSNLYTEFYDMYDVPYWNSFYPDLPRLVLADPILNPSFDFETRMIYRINSCPNGNYMKKYYCVDNVQSSVTGVTLHELPKRAQSNLIKLTKNRTGQLRFRDSPRYFGVQGTN
jgi:hypothetical protein